MKSIWVTWENQVRNKSMAFILGANLYIFVEGGNRLTRYLICTYKTIAVLLKEKPSIVFVQNPSIVLNYLLIAMRFIFRYKLVSDAHYAGVTASNGSKVLQKALDYCNYLVDLVIVTNSEHGKYIHDIGGKSIICEDPLPDIKKGLTEKKGPDKVVLFICSFDVDEPFEKVFKAAELLAKDEFKLLVTGNYSKVNINPLEYPHVKFLGYLPESDFHENLLSCSVVLDLTENENCLVCGAYEAMAAEKPLVTSDTECLKNYFTKGTVFTNHDETTIASSIKLAYCNKDQLINEIKLWKDTVYSSQIIRVLSIYTALEK